jgi:hypothetical protein
MENNIQNKSFLEIPLTPCSNIHLFKQLHLLISQNHLPIDLTHSRPAQTGGGSSFVYQPEYTPYTIFEQFMDKLFLQKKHDDIQDSENNKVLESMFSKDKNKTQIIQSVKRISEIKKKEEEDAAKNKSGQKTETKLAETKPKKTIKPIEETNQLFMRIKTNQSDPIQAIKGTKLYYLYKRQQEHQCAHLV